VAARRDDVYCPCCGETHRRARRRDGLCFICGATNQRRGECSVCGKVGPLEDHHVAGRRNAPDIIPACLNCHGILSHYQRYWHPDWLRATRPNLFMMQGYIDLLHVMEMRADDAEFAGRTPDTAPGPGPGTDQFASRATITLVGLVILTALACLALRFCVHQGTDDDSDDLDDLVEPWRYP
jgi:hypothetical protein